MAPYRVPPPGFFHHGVPSLCSHPWCPGYTPTAPQSIVVRMRGPRSHRGYTRIFLSLGFALLGHRGYTRISTRLAKPALRSWVIADTLASPRGSQCFRISALSEGHRGYTRISPDLCECPPLAFSLHCDPSQFRHFSKKGCMASVSPDTPRIKNSRLHGPVPSHPCHSRVLTPSPILTSDRRLLRRASSQRRWLLTPGPGSRGTGQHGVVCHQAGRTNRTHRTHPDS